MQKRKFYFNTKKNKTKKILAFIFIPIVALLFIYSFFIKPAVLSVIEYQGKINASTILTGIIDGALEEISAEHDDFVEIKSDLQGNITSITTKGVNVNALKNNIMKRITDTLSDGNSVSTELPIGTLLGSELFLGKGPPVKMTLSAIGYANIELISHFEEAGINQTNHSIFMRVLINYTTILPIGSTKGSIESEYLVSQTLIVGKVPQFYGGFSKDA